MWVVVGYSVSGDEDEEFPTEAYGPFDTFTEAKAWLEDSPTVIGEAYELIPPAGLS